MSPRETIEVGDVWVPVRNPPRTPVCTTCGDTHRMDLHYENGDVQEVMCTHCPRPCQACRAGGNGPFCEVTPCDCSCHHGTPPDPEIGAKLAARSELANAKAGYAAAQRAWNAAQGRLSKARAAARKLGVE